MNKEREECYKMFAVEAERKAVPTSQPVVYASFAKHGLRPPLLRLDLDDVDSAIPLSYAGAQWLREQIRTFDCRTQRIVCYVFDDCEEGQRAVRSDVLHTQNSTAVPP